MELPGFADLKSKGISLLCGPPGKPYAKSITHNSILLQWSKAEHQGSNSHPIQHYYVHYKSSTSIGTWRMVQSKAFEETLEIVRLPPSGMPFIFKVQAVNAVGAGVPSENSDPVYLMQQSLLIPKDFPSKPGKPKSLIVTHDSIQLEWTKPEKGAESITSYTVLYHAQYSDPPDHWKEIRAASRDERVLVRHLLESTTYLFQVLPECEDGVGLESDISDPITTKMVMVSKPGKPRGTGVSHDSIQLEWTKPEEGSHNITSYTILGQSVNDPSNQWITWKTEIAEEKMTLTQLSKETVYYFKIRPDCEESFGIESDISEPTFIRTSKLGEPEVTPLQVLNGI